MLPTMQTRHSILCPQSLRLENRQDFLAPAYRALVMENTLAWKELLRVVADPARRPVLFHCDTGKDRTGVGAALILLACGIPVHEVGALVPAG